MSTRGHWDVMAERGLRVDSPAPIPAPAAIQPARAAWLTYEPFYGLKEQPFSIASNPAFFHQSRSHAATFQALLAGIRRRERLSVLTGDIGTGKTTLCRAVLENLDRETFSAFVADPFASREDLLKVLLMEFGVMSLDDLTSGRLKTATRTELSYLLYDFLGKLTPLQAFAVVVIDEAQNLSLPLLEELRILSDFDGRDRQLQVVLVGQLELRQKLKLAEMRQVDQRVSVRCHLEPLRRDGIAAYVAHRLRVAGGTPDRISFSAEACDAVYHASSGVPRVINRICDRALHQGHLKRAAVITRDMVDAAIIELGEAVPTAAMDPVAVVEAAAARGGQADGLERLPAWLAGAPGAAAATRHDAAPIPAREPAPAQRSQSISLPRPSEDQRQPATYMEQVTRRWTRVAVAAMVVLGGLGALGAGVAATGAFSPDAGDAPALPPLPAAVRPATPVAFVPPARVDGLQPASTAAGTFTIEIAVFETQQGAAWLAADLTAAGFRAYGEALDLPNRGIQHLVSVGPYATRGRAEFDLQRLHQAGGYEYARLRGN